MIFMRGKLSINVSEINLKLVYDELKTRDNCHTIISEGCIMKLNVGPGDKAFRTIVGLLIVALGLWQDMLALSIFGLIIFASGMMSWCPVYAIFKINTIDKKKKNK